MVGPTISMSLSEIPEVVFIEVSKVARIFVVVLVALFTACIHVSRRPQMEAC